MSSTHQLHVETAWHQVETWLSHPLVWVPAPGQRHGEILASMLIANRASGNLVPDTHMAALALDMD
jgi:hypothetical protein